MTEWVCDRVADVPTVSAPLSFPQPRDASQNMGGQEPYFNSSASLFCIALSNELAVYSSLNIVEEERVELSFKQKDKSHWQWKLSIMRVISNIAGMPMSAKWKKIKLILYITMIYSAFTKINS